MTNKKSTRNFGTLAAYNYCLGFIDLLGQRDATKGQRLLPILKSEDDKKKFQATVRKSIGSIDRLQKDAETMLGAIGGGRAKSPLRKRLSKKEQKMWDKMQVTRINKQRWSDGFAAFVCLGDQEVSCPMNGIFEIFAMCGSLCFLGLAAKKPIRGAIDIAWGVELHLGELYGPVVARAYELESETAQYPRIVVGSQVVHYLQSFLTEPTKDKFMKFNQTLARLCLNMLAHDVDGVNILHYLGNAFRDSITQTQHPELYDKAHEFVREQLRMHQEAGDSKLAFRYAHLAYYFQAHQPRR